MNLNDGLRELPYIQPEMRDRILKHYLRQIRKYYVSKFLQFNKDMKEWNERQEANKSLRAVAGEFATFAEDNLPPSFMKALHDPAPPPPTLCICMPEKMMAYILDLASMNVPVESGRYPAFTEVSPSQFPQKEPNDGTPSLRSKSLQQQWSARVRMAAPRYILRTAHLRRIAREACRTSHALRLPSFLRPHTISMFKNVYHLIIAPRNKHTRVNASVYKCRLL